MPRLFNIQGPILEKYLEAFRDNVNKGLFCELRFDGNYLALSANSREALVGQQKIPAETAQKAPLYEGLQ